MERDALDTATPAPRKPRLVLVDSAGAVVAEREIGTSPPLPILEVGRNLARFGRRAMATARAYAPRRQRAPQARRALPVTVRTAPRARAHRSAASRPAATSAGPPDSDEPAPALGGPNRVEIIEIIESASRREGASRA